MTQTKQDAGKAILKQTKNTFLSRREAVLVMGVACLTFAGCKSEITELAGTNLDLPVDDVAQGELSVSPQEEPETSEPTPEETPEEAPKAPENTSKPVGNLSIHEDFRTSLYHGEKGAAYQKYIMLHDTEVDASPDAIVSSWANNGNLIAAHFTIGKDGRVVQCVPMDKIAHHAGFGDVGKNEKYGITEDGRDDKRGTTSIGSRYPDYGMNAWSIGIELVHVGQSAEYPKAQLETLDLLIAHIDNYFGFKSQIIDHKAWRSTNSDTSAAFATYLKNYQSTRKHTG